MAEPVSKPVVAGTYGFPLLVDVRFDFTGYSALYLRFYKPDGTFHIEKGSGDGVTDNGDPTGEQILYTVEAALWPSDTNLGEWKVVGRVTFTGQDRRSNPAGRIPVVAEAAD